MKIIHSKGDKYSKLNINLSSDGIFIRINDNAMKLDVDEALRIAETLKMMASILIKKEIMDEIAKFKKASDEK